MKVIVAHRAPDMDAITSIWLIKRFLEGWEDAHIEFVPAGEKLQGKYESIQIPGEETAIEIIDGKEVIHVDTGLGKLDHHQTESNNICAAILAYDYVKSAPHNSLTINPIRINAARRIVELAIDEDHFQEVYYSKETSFLYDFSIPRLIDGYKIKNYHEDNACVEFGMTCLDAALHVIEARIWAEEEITKKGIEFETRYGRGMAVETINDMVLELAQKMGYVMAVRRDPHYGYLRIKARPVKRKSSSLHDKNILDSADSIDLTNTYEALKMLDPHASWFLHVSKKMLLNGSSKNPNMGNAANVTLEQVIEVLRKI